MKQSMESLVSEHWDRNAEQWARDVRAGFDTYRDHFTLPAFLAILPDLTGLTVIDFGCGEGTNTRLLARQGALMTGIDLSERMLALATAQEEAQPLGITYRRTSFSHCPDIATGNFDAVISTMALMDGPDFAGAMREAHRILKPGGFLAFSILHPCFISAGLRWITNPSGETVGLGVAHYFRRESFVEEWKFGDNPDKANAEPFAVPRFPRTLSDILNAVSDAGFIIKKIDEPMPTEDACKHFPRFRRWRDLAAFLLIVRAEKPA
ncbi:class I SAM-dependent methyltransferase [Rhizobium helianthi]|uniref:Class I SAM-dependent methyltransferase n=1 Tax=Rhizobium helianthi TaxID=1132695 RepID=A0ABW4LXY5_9HYPH